MPPLLLTPRAAHSLPSSEKTVCARRAVRWGKCGLTCSLLYVFRAAETAAAEALAAETNPWNTVYGMVEPNAAAAAGATQKYNECLLSLQKNGKAGK